MKKKKIIYPKESSNYDEVGNQIIKQERKKKRNYNEMVNEYKNEPNNYIMINY